MTPARPLDPVTTVVEVRRAVAAARGAGRTIALVPTMGDLHRGHLTLVERARRECDWVAVSVFVNPLQFGPHEDFAAYPRRLEEDRRRLEETGVDLLFAPEPATLYPRGLAATTRVAVPELGEMLCGASRPGHFAGVATVVLTLLNVVAPDVAVFGEKDYQQLQVIRRMVADLMVPVRVVGVATVREPDGLALSSRNRYLTPEQRARAPALHRALGTVAAALVRGERDFAALEARAVAALDAAGLGPDYVAIREAETLAPPGPDSPAYVVLAAAWLGRARLIDNVVVGSQ